MGLSPEEKRKIYEEEKARIDAEERAALKKAAEGSTSTGLKPNDAGLLCYVGIWISGIIFLIIEQKNRFVRFHAAQSIIVFGILTIAGIILGSIPFVGGAFSTIISVLGFILWIVLMIKAHQGQLYKIPWAGNVAEKMLASIGEQGREDIESVKKEEPPEPPEPEEPPSPPAADLGKRIGERVEGYFKSTKAGRVTASSFAIAWSIVLLIFFNFFSKYIAYYQHETAGGVREWTRYPVLTGEYSAWLPILTTTLILSVIGHIILIIFDRYVLREITLIVLNALGIAVVATLLSIYPFDFSVIPNITVAGYVNLGVRIALICVTVGLSIGTLVMFIKLMVNVGRQNIPY